MKILNLHHNPKLLITMAAFVLAAVLAVSCCSRRYETLNVDGTNRKYLLHVPSNLPANATVPLVLALHQFSDTPQGMQTLTNFDAMADREGFIVAYPKGQWRIWRSGVNDDDRDLRFLIALMDDLEVRYPIDPERIYATGASAGAMMIQRLATHTARLAAIAPVMGSLSANFPAAAPVPAPLPVLVMHGMEDPVIPYEGGAAGGPHESMFLSAHETAAFWAQANGCESEPVLDTDIKDGHGTVLVNRYTYPCSDDNKVFLYAVVSCGHSWPGHHSRYPSFIVGPSVVEPNASEIIWHFFKEKRNPRL